METTSFRGINLSGKRFGKLSVISFDKYHKNQKRWKCMCDCGNTVSLPHASLTRTKSNTTNCGCKKVERAKTLNRLDLGQAAKNVRIKTYKSRAKKMNLPFILTDIEFFNLTQQACHYCGVEPHRSSITSGSHFYGDFIYNGIDRIDSNLGYTLDNSVSCCWMCNMGKVDSNYNDFINHLDQITKYRSSL